MLYGSFWMYPKPYKALVTAPFSKHEWKFPLIVLMESLCMARNSIWNKREMKLDVTFELISLLKAGLF